MWFHLKCPPLWFQNLWGPTVGELRKHDLWGPTVGEQWKYDLCLSYYLCRNSIDRWVMFAFCWPVPGKSRSVQYQQEHGLLRYHVLWIKLCLNCFQETALTSCRYIHCVWCRINVHVSYQHLSFAYQLFFISCNFKFYQYL